MKKTAAIMLTLSVWPLVGIATARARFTIQPKSTSDVFCKTDDDCTYSQMGAQFSAINKDALAREVASRDSVKESQNSLESRSEIILGGPGKENLPCQPFPEVKPLCVSHKCVLKVEGETDLVDFFEGSANAPEGAGREAGGFR